MFWVIVIGLVVLFVFLWFKFIKMMKFSALNVIDGDLGAGKSFSTHSFAIRKAKGRIFWQNVRKLLVYCHLVFIPKLRKKIESEEPISICCVIPVDYKVIHQKRFNLEKSRLQHKMVWESVGYLPITKNVVLRKERLPKRSVFIFDELSLLFDQNDFKNPVVNEQLSEFFKLFRHEGNYLGFINTQAISDCHISLRRCVNRYLYISHKTRLLFGSLLTIEERAYSEDGSVVQVQQGDLQNNLKLYWIPNKWFKVYDHTAHSWLTDCIPYTFNERFDTKGNLKSRLLWTLKEMSFLFQSVPDDELTKEQLEVKNRAKELEIEYYQEETEKRKRKREKKLKEVFKDEKRKE